MNLVGHFYFKKTSSGNLIGEFSNNTLTTVQTESSDEIKSLKNEINKSFIGNYKSTWFENKASNLLELVISIKPNSNENIFILKWQNKKGIDIFSGEGFIVDNMLRGIIN